MNENIKIAIAYLNLAEIYFSQEREYDDCKIIANIINKYKDEDKDNLENKNINNEVISRVYQVMKDNRYKNGQVKGISIIADKLKMKEKEVQHIHALLNKMGRIYTRDKKTYMKG